MSEWNLDLYWLYHSNVHKQCIDCVCILLLSCLLQIKERARIIFGTADRLRCKILTSNDGFIRAAAAQGVTIAAVTHQSRALSEQKRLEETAKNL